MEHPGEERQAEAQPTEAEQGKGAQASAPSSESARPTFSKEDLTRVLDEIRPVVDDVRRALRQGFAKEDGTLRHTFARAGAAVKQWSAKRSAHKAEQGGEGSQAHETDPQRIADEVRDAFGNLQKVVGEMRQSLDAFIEGLSAMKKEGAQPQAEQPPQQAQPTQPQPEEQPQQAQPAQPQPEEQPQQAQAAQSQPEEQPQQAQPARPKPEEQPQQAQPAQPQPEEQPQQAQPQPAPAPQEPGTLALFDGSDASFGQWKLVGEGTLENKEGELRLQSGAGVGLAYFTGQRFDDVRLKLQFRPGSPQDLMGLAVRFQNPSEPVADRDDPSILYPYDNQAYVAVHTGFETQLGAKRPGLEPGTIEGVLLGDASGTQRHAERASVNVGDWNDLELEARGDRFTVRLNGKETSQFTNSDSFRAKRAAEGPNAGFVGILLRSGQMAFRAIEAVTQLEQPGAEQAEEGQGAPQQT